MSGYKGHLIGYFLVVFPVTLIGVSKEFLPQELVTIILGFVLGAFYTILPDIDTPSSKARRIIGKLFLTITVFCLTGFLTGLLTEIAVYLALALNLSLYLLWFIKHRGILHTIIAGTLFSTPLLIVNWVYAFYALLGFTVHLILDGELAR